MSAAQFTSLTASGLSLSRGPRQLIADLSFSLAAGSAMLMRGANGCGKTSLLRVLAGLASADRGNVECQGRTLRPFAPEWRRNVIYAGHSDAIKHDFSAAENLAVLLAFDGVEVAPAAFDQALEKVQLHDRRHLPAHKLSQGQKRRIGLARLLLSQKPLWLLDEPTNALDAEGVELFADIVHQHLQQGGMACIATHLPLELGATVQQLNLGSRS